MRHKTFWFTIIIQFGLDLLYDSLRIAINIFTNLLYGKYSFTKMNWNELIKITFIIFYILVQKLKI
jgi:hypothetical protein